MKYFFSFLMLVVVVVFSANAQITSAGSGNWSSTSTWTGGVVPGAGDDVVIQDGHTISLDGANTFACANLTIGQGSSGILNYASTATAANSLTINGDLVLSAGSQFLLGSLPSVLTNVYVKGNINVGNGASLNHGSGSTKGVKVNFTKNTSEDQTVTATGTPTIIQFNNVIVDRPNTTDRVVANCNIYLRAGNAALVLTKGIWEQTAGLLNDTSSTTANVNLGTADGTLKITNDGSFICTSSIVGAGGSNGSDAKIYINTTGTFTVGAKNSQARLQNSNDLEIVAGTVNIYGRFTISAAATISGGTINIDPQGPVGLALGNTSNTFEVTTSGSLTMSGGTITLIDPIQATGTGLDIKFSTSATYNITGGTIRVGDGVSTTAGADGFQISTHSVPLWNLELNGNNTSASRMVTLTDGSAARNLVVKNNLAINSGTLNANVGTGSNLTLSGEYSNSGTVNLGTGTTITLNGSSAQSTGSTFPSSVPNLSLQNNSGITLTNAVAVSNNLTITGNNFNLTGSNVSISAGTVSVTHTTPDFNGSNLSSTLDDGGYSITRKSNQYWTLTQPGISGTYNLSLDVGAQTGITDTTNLRIIHSNDGTNFDVVGTHSDGSATAAHRSGITGSTQGRFYLGGEDLITNPLPVELQLFTASSKRGTVELAWSTAIEVNNHGFAIERKAIKDGKLTIENWGQVGFVEGSGTSNTPKQYSFSDKNVDAGTYSYRLKQIDRDGKFEYSQSIEVNVAGNPTTLALQGNYPNPFNPTTNISFTVPSEGRAVVRVFDVLGKEVATVFNEVAMSGKQYSVPFNAVSLPSGIYFSQLEFGGQKLVKKMLLMK